MDSCAIPLHMFPRALKYISAYTLGQWGSLTGYISACGLGKWGQTKIFLLISDKTSYTFYLAFRPGEVEICPEAVIFVSDDLPPPLLFFWHKPIHHTIRMLGNGQELFYYFCFLGFPFLITILPLNNLIIVIPIIVIIPYIYLLLINKLVGEKLQGRRIIFYCLITHFLCFKVIREIVQLPWVYFKGLDTQFLCFKTIRNNVPFFIIIDIFNSC